MHTPHGAVLKLQVWSIIPAEPQTLLFSAALLVLVGITYFSDSLQIYS